jgi:tRNA A-37 threonylcarbamoyl transferase component Bud32
MTDESATAPNDAGSGSTQRMLDTALAEQRMRWRSGTRELVEEHLERRPDLRSDHDAVLDLLYNEVLLRRERGEQPALDEYLRRFPNIVEPLRLLFEVDEELEDDSRFLSVDMTAIGTPPSDGRRNPTPADGVANAILSPTPMRHRSGSDANVAPRLVATDSFRGTVELHAMLQKRLRFLSILLTLIYAQFGPLYRIIWRMDGWPTVGLHMGMVWMVLAVAASCAAFLLLKRQLMSMLSLRVIEWLLFACPVVQATTVVWDLTWRQGDLLRSLQSTEHADAYFFHTIALLYFPFVTVYGILIPNTWRRCLVATSLIGVTPLVVLLAGLPTSPEVWTAHGTGYLIGFVYVAMWMGVGVACAAYGCHRINVLQQEAFVARRLGQYRLRERIGSGGMGEVYLAEHVLLKQPCAVKIIRPERTGDPAALRRFEREVQATARLKHWNTVTIFDFGIAADGTFYYAMEYLPGLNLEEMVRRFGPLPAARVRHFLRQACAALSEAHAIGLIHRDIKPANLIVCERGGVDDVVKVLDFGLVRVVNPAGQGHTLTAEGMIAGTPAYMSPEQASGAGDLDARSDIYSLGAVAYFLLAGQPPFGDRTQVQALAAHLYEAPRPLEELQPDVPANLAAVVARCLAKEPQRRFEDIASLDAALVGDDVANGWSQADAAQWWREYGGRFPTAVSTVVPGKLGTAPAI